MYTVEKTKKVRKRIKNRKKMVGIEARENGTVLDWI